MITSMMGRMADAEKLSIQQLQQAIKSGSIPAYVGVPMLQDKVKQAQQAKQPQPMPPQPPVAQQVMAEASGIEAMPSNLPAAGYNDGGIVAFAEGGMDDEYDPEEYEDQVAESEYAGALQDMAATQEEMMQHQLQMQQANSELRNAGKDVHRTPDVEGGIKELGDNKRYDEHKFVRGVSGGHKGIDYAMPVGTPISPKVEGILRYNTRDKHGWGNAAEIVSDDGRVLQRFAHLSKFAAPEGSRVGPGQVIALSGNTGRSTGPHLHVENFYADGGITRLNNVPRFGDGGSTWRDYAAPLIPGAAIYTVGTRLGNAMQSGIEGVRGSVANATRDNPVRNQMAKDYTEHLSELTPFEEDQPTLTPMSEALRNYGHKITQRYAKPSDNVPPKARPYTDSGMFSGLPPESPAATAATPSATTPAETGTDKLIESLKNEYGSGSKPPQKTEAGGEKVGGGGDGNVPSGPSGQTTGINALTPRKSAFDEFAEEYKRNKEELKKQKEEDKYMALLSAGLGMMSGTSPNALANIGQGAMQGVAYQSQANKQRAAERAAIEKSMMSAQRYKSMEEIALANQALRERIHGDTAGIQRSKLGLEEELKNLEIERRSDRDIQDMIKNAQANALKTLKDQWPETRQLTDKEGYKAAIAAAENNPLVTRLTGIYNQRLSSRYPEMAGSPSQPPANRKPISAYGS